MAETQWLEPTQAAISPSENAPIIRRSMREGSLPQLLPQVGNTRVSDIVMPESAATVPRKLIEGGKSFKVIESWVGRVDKVNAENGAFTATVASDKFEGTREIAEFMVEEISEDDRALVVAGSIFYWSVGYQLDEFGGRSTASVVRFRRLRHWKRNELVEARARAAKYADWFLGSSIDSIDGARP